MYRLLLLACSMTFALPAFVGAQDKAALSEPERTKLVERLRRLDADSTDWTLLQDIGEKTKALGSKAVPVVVAEIEAASKQSDPRYGIRLMGVLARIDPGQGVAKLEAVIASSDANSAVAARVLGRSAPAANVAAVVSARLPVETRNGVASALALAAGDAGATAVAKPLREMIESGKAPRQSLQWFSIALAQVADKDMQAEAPKWLQAGAKLAATGLLLVRRSHDPKAEQPLLELLPKVTDKGTLAWFAQTLGAIGGDASRAALRTALATKLEKEKQDLAEEGGVAMGSTELEPMRLALLRLGDPESVKWAKALVSNHGSGAIRAGDKRVTYDVMGPEIAQMPELLGKWNVAGSVEVLVAATSSASTPPWMRAYAARGLCWRRDARGLSAAAAILAIPNDEAPDPFLAKGLEVAQQTLHEFVADLDRPDYLPIDPQAAAPAGGVGELWQQWLAKRASKIKWREPPQDATDLLLWY